MKDAVRVLAVDDSSFFLEVLREVLEADGNIRVVAEATDAKCAMAELERHAPDLVTLDLNMPGQDGLTTLEQIMASRPVPVVVLTAQPTRGERNCVYEATRRGALDLLDKREACGTLESQARLRELIRQLSKVQVIRHPAPRPAATDAPAAAPWIWPRSQLCPVVGIGASAGGPQTLAGILAALPRDLPAGIAVAQHISRGFAESFARWLQEATGLRVRLVEQVCAVEPGVVLLAGEGRHLAAIDPRHFIATDAIPGRRYVPSVDVLFSSLARVHGASAVGALLTGMGDDGAQGLLEMRKAGAFTFAQDEQSSVVFGMPRAAIQLAAAQRVLGRDALPAALCEAVRTLREGRGARPQ